jgi:hypothetical protein
VTIAVNTGDFLPSSTVYVATVNGQSGAVTITSSTLGVATNTLSLFNGNGFTTTTIAAVLKALSASGLATYNSSTGAFAVSSSSLNLGSASQRATSDFLASSTAFVSTVNGQSGAVTVTGVVTTTINNTQATVFHVVGDGSTVTSTVNGATTTFSILTTGNWVGTWQGVNSSTFYLASNPNNYISSSTGNTLYYPLNTNPSGYVATGSVATLGSPLTIGGSVTSTIYGSATSTYIANFNGKYQFPTPTQLSTVGCMGSSTISDATTCLRYVYDLAPSSMEIDVGPYTYTTAASTTFATNGKYLLIKGVPGGATVFQSSFATTGQCDWTFNIGNAKQTGWGLDGIYFQGPNSGQSLGLCWGGNQGAEGGGLHNSLVQHFFHNIKITDNTYMFIMDHSVSNFNVSGGRHSLDQWQHKYRRDYRC